MDQDRLTSLVEQPEVQEKILDGYQGAYSLGVTTDPNDRKRLSIRVRIVAKEAVTIPSQIELDGEKVPVIVNRDFKPPIPQ